MNTSLVLKRTILILIVLAASIVFTIVFFSPSPGSSSVSADQYLVVKNNDLFTISETLGEKQLTKRANAKFIFDEKESLILFGKGWGNETVESESIGGTELWLLDKITGKEIQLTKGFEVREAVLGNNGQVYYATRDQDLFVTNARGEKKKIQEKVLGPVITKDGKLMVYQKLPSTWQNGNYYDGALGLTLLDLNYLKETRLTNKWEDWGPTFSPDGKKVVYVSDTGFFVININGSSKVQLTSTAPFPSEQPVFSNNSRFFSFEADREIWVMEFNKSLDKVVKVKKVAKGINPKFSADGKSLTILPPPDENVERKIITIDLSSHF